jgi:putative ubiquitin-RnfH superfamily antitoxin RatB of RatAB toxin-antitoxin module
MSRTGAPLATRSSARVLLDQFPEIDLTENKVGIFGRLIKLETRLGDGDRVEIYRPITADPETVDGVRGVRTRPTELRLRPRNGYVGGVGVLIDTTRSPLEVLLIEHSYRRPGPVRRGCRQRASSR